MDAAINATFSHCSYSTANSTIQLFNSTMFTDPIQFEKIACEAARLQDLKKYFQVIQLKIYAAGSILGFISSILALLAYSIKGFDATAFHYYRAINVFDMIYQSLNLCIGFRLDTGSAIGNCIILFYGQVAAKCGRFLVLWTAIDRAISCHLPFGYSRLDSRRMAITVITVVILISLAYNFFLSYFDWRLIFFNIPAPTTMLGLFYQIWRGLEGLSMLITLPFVIRGLQNMTKRKKNLIAGGDVKQGQNKDLLNQIRINRSLCILQLCEGIPYILVVIFDYISYMTNFLGYSREPFPWVTNGTYDQNVLHQRIFEVQIYFDTFCLSLADVYCHGCHFFTYMAFSPKFRNTVLGFIKTKLGKSNVVATSNMYNTSTRIM